MWDLCFEISARVVAGVDKSSCDEHEDGGNGPHFERDGSLSDEKYEVVGLKRELRDHLMLKHSFIACLMPRGRYIMQFFYFLVDSLWRDI